MRRGGALAGHWRRSTWAESLTSAAVTVLIAAAVGFAWSLVDGNAWWYWASLWLVCSIIGNVQLRRRRRRLRQELRVRYGYVDDQTDEPSGFGGGVGEDGRVEA